MKKMIWSIVKILLSVSMIPLWFVKIFKGIGHLLDQETGKVVEVVFRHSMFENICDGWHPVLVYLSMALIIASAVFNIVVLKYSSHKKIYAVSNIVFWTALALFIVLILLASTVARAY